MYLLTLDLQHQIESLNLELEMVQNKVSSLQAELELVQADKKTHTRSSSSAVGIEIEELKAAMVKSDQAHAEHMESLRGKDMLMCMKNGVCLPFASVMARIQGCALHV